MLKLDLEKSSLFVKGGGGCFDFPLWFEYSYSAWEIIMRVLNIGDIVANLFAASASIGP